MKRKSSFSVDCRNQVKVLFKYTASQINYASSKISEMVQDRGIGTVENIVQSCVWPTAPFR